MALAALAGFIGYKVRSVAQELTNPPFYHPQPLTKVEETYQELARGGKEKMYASGGTVRTGLDRAAAPPRPVSRA